MHIYGVNINHNLYETLFQEMTQYVSPEKKAKIHRFRKPVDRVRSLFGDLIIRYILCKHYGLHNNEIRYEYQEFGKPYLPLHPHYHFNISHSGDWVVGVVSTSLVGIDIEKITDLKTDASSLALTAEEIEKFRKLNDPEKNAYFFELWTLKESYTKATGKGLSEGLNTLRISTDNGIIHILKDENTIDAYFQILECIAGYKFSLCSLSESLHKNIKLFPLNGFSEEAKAFFML
jgi:4'-phosphopantetheinyl transferase